MSALVVLGANDSVAHAASGLGIDVVHVLLPGTNGLPGARVIHSDYRNPAEFETFIDDSLSQLKAEAVVSITELGLEPAAVASHRLGLPGVPLEVVRATRDKYRMRQILQERAPHLNPPFALADDPSEVRRLFSAGVPVVAKPVDGAGSANVALLLNESELPNDRRSTATLLEHFAEGDEYSVECLSQHGRHTILGIAEKGITTGFVECSHLMPPVSLDEAGCRVVESVVVELLDALGLRDGPSHTEVKVDNGRVTVIETHTRLGGDGIADLVELTTGVNWRQAALAWPLGIQRIETHRAAGAAGKVFFTARPGVVSHVAPAPELRDATVVDWKLEVAPGDVVRPLHSSEDRLGVATITASTPASCADAVAKLREAQIITTV